MPRAAKHSPPAHDPAHDHKACIEEALRAADAVCASRGLNLTPIRRRVLEIVWRQHEPIGAYDILGQLTTGTRKAAPPTVYRALEFLIEAGLVHRIDSLNAFKGCDAPQHAHASNFLVCRSCHRVEEINDRALEKALAERMRTAGFAAEGASLEIKGVCRECGSMGSAGK
jgi:Fur family transcriptional regulator, zinc uptake regulator